jgi:hypothetical protein
MRIFARIIVFKRNNILDRCYRDEEENTRGPYARYIHQLSVSLLPARDRSAFPFSNVILSLYDSLLACAASFHRMIATRLRFLALPSSSIYSRRR